ncbi:MAG: serine/threonine protein kinase [Planctomycetota bacterium]|nr:MAG: serine/threonine protein kinase [Planctomycetota bacterium]
MNRGSQHSLPGFQTEEILKADHFGRLERGCWKPPGQDAPVPAVLRLSQAGPWWCRPLSRYLAAREAKALAHLQGAASAPRLLLWKNGHLLRSWTSGAPMQRIGPADPDYFQEARRLLIRLHRKGVTHNDLAKEPNWLVTEEGRPALVDFQLASCHRRRGWWFRLQAREDLRHLLKHKRHYRPDLLTAKEEWLLARPSWPARLWRATGKRIYLFLTRRLLGWADREGAGDRWTRPPAP